MSKQRTKITIGILGMSIVLSCAIACQKQIETKTTAQENAELEALTLKKFLAQQINVDEKDLYIDYADSTIVDSQTGIKEKINIIRQYYSIINEIKQF